MVNHSAVQPEDADLQHDMVPDAVRALASGALAVIIDDGHPDGLGYLIMAAELARWEPISFLVRHTSGFLCVALPSDRADALDLPPMVPGKGASAGPAFSVSVDARDGITTGISARDRARTVRLLADSATTAVDLCRPGHVMPIRIQTDGVRGQAQVPEAAVDLCRLAGVAPVAVLCEIVAEDGSLANRATLGEFAREHRLPVVTVRQLVTYQKHRSGSVQAVAASRLPTAFGTFTAHAYRSSSGAEHLALVMGNPEHATPPLVRVHSECLTGDVLTSLRCDCGTQLTDSLRIIAEARTGVLIYLRGHEGRGIGLAAKVAAYQLQDEGYDTVDANVALGEPVDGRHYADAALILEDLHLRRIRLLTNNPDKCGALAEAGIDVVERVPLPPSAIGEDNISYLRTKSSRMGHLITDLGNPA